jgi:hypothetical protein
MHQVIGLRQFQPIGDGFTKIAVPDLNLSQQFATKLGSLTLASRFYGHHGLIEVQAWNRLHLLCSQLVEPLHPWFPMGVQRRMD